MANGLDARVASGPDALRITLNRFKTTIAVLEPVVEKLKAKPRVKSAHVVDSEDREDSDLRSWDQLYVIDNRLTSSGRWWKRDFPFPCPLGGHDHDLSTCKEFHKMTPKERQVECQGRICKTCLKAGGNCLGPKGKCNTKVPAEALGRT